jgi:hypothetical protein
MASLKEVCTALKDITARYGAIGADATRSHMPASDNVVQMRRQGCFKSGKQLFLTISRAIISRLRFVADRQPNPLELYRIIQ